MSFILTDDGKCLFGYLTIDFIKHIIMRWMRCTHFILAHMSGMVALMERIEDEVNVVV